MNPVEEMTLDELSKRSTCARLHVGAVVTTADHRQVLSDSRRHRGVTTYAVSFVYFWQREVE
jgi:hypothetical protein